MLRRFCNDNQKPRWTSLIAGAVLGLYLFACVAAPSVHWFLFDHNVETKTSYVPENKDVCPLCEFLRLAVPFFAEDEPFQVQSDIVAESVFTISNPLVAYAAVLPPCRAPPAV